MFRPQGIAIARGWAQATVRVLANRGDERPESAADAHVKDAQ